MVRLRGLSSTPLNAIHDAVVALVVNSWMLMWVMANNAGRCFPLHAIIRDGAA